VASNFNDVPAYVVYYHRSIEAREACRFTGPRLCPDAVMRTAILARHTYYTGRMILEPTYFSSRNIHADFHFRAAKYIARGTNRISVGLLGPLKYRTCRYMCVHGWDWPKPRNRTNVCWYSHSKFAVARRIVIYVVAVAFTCSSSLTLNKSSLVLYNHCDYNLRDTIWNILRC
jgi:hypothetical protein